MKKIIRLTENELKRFISESVTKILNESPYGGRWDRNGRIPRDGMTGGSWGSSDVYGTYQIDVSELADMLDGDTGDDYFYMKLEKLKDGLYFKVKGKYGYDDSVGIPEGFSDIEVDMSPCIGTISNLSLFRGDEIRAIKDALQVIASEIENGNVDNVRWR
jgi:hypothetical protein